MNIENIDTPAFLVDLEKVEQNCEAMRKKCDILGIAMRPHMKTHKTGKIGELMTNGTKRKIVVSTLAEAEHFAELGFDDILYGFPVIKHNLKRCHKLLKKLDQFHLLLDNSSFLPELEQFQPPALKKWSIFLSINTGYQREGIIWNKDDTITELIKNIEASTNATFMGLYTHCGNSYNSNGSSDSVRNTAILACQRIQHVKQTLLKSGIHCKVVSTGSTPSCSQDVKEFSDLTEIHPGNYVFYDTMQMSFGSCKEMNIAGKVASRIVGICPDDNYFLIDCGFLGLSKDCGSSVDSEGYALFQDHPNLKLFYMSQELGKVTSRDGKLLDWPNYPINSILYLFPWHSCFTAAMFPVYYCHRNGTIVDTVRPCKHW